MKILDRVKTFLLGGDGKGPSRALTQGYEPPRTQAWGYQARFLPPFDFHWIRMMLLDSTIRLGLAMRAAPVCSAEIAYPEDGENGKTNWVSGVEANNPEVAEFVRQQTERFWRNDVPRIVEAQVWGWIGAEVIYKEQNGKIVFDRMEERHAQDVRVLERDGRMQAVRFRNIKNNCESTIDIDIPKAFWHGFRANSGEYYPESILFGAYSPWFDKWTEGGALDTRRLFMHKDAYGGQTMKYPSGTTYIDGRGEIPNRDIAREMVEQAIAGAVITMPSDMSVNGHAMWEFVHATVASNPTHILQYPQDLDVEMLRGIEIPDDILTAEASGSWEGKRVPQNAFYTGLDVWVGGLLRDWKRQVMSPLVYWNYGPNAEFELRHKPLALQAQEQSGEKDEDKGEDPFGGMFGGGGGGGGAPGGQQQPPQPQQQQQMSLQRSDAESLVGRGVVSALEIVSAARLALDAGDKTPPDPPPDPGDANDMVILEGEKAREEGKQLEDNPYDDSDLLRSLLWSIGFTTQEADPQKMSLNGQRIIRFSVRAPKGGLQVAGKFYKGGQFIPGTELSSATEKELNTLNKESNVPKIGRDSKAFKHLNDLSRLVSTGKVFEAKNRLESSREELTAAGLEEADIDYLVNKLSGRTISGKAAPEGVRKREEEKVEETERPRRITKEDVDSKPWEYSPDQYQIGHGVHQPWIGEISGVQRGRMSKRQEQEYDKKRDEEWKKSGDKKAEWTAKVTEAYESGEITKDTPNLSSEAKSVIFRNDRKKEERATKEAESQKSKAREIHSPNDVAVGDKVDSVFYGKNLEVTKVNKKSVILKTSFGSSIKVPFEDASGRAFISHQEGDEKSQAITDDANDGPQEGDINDEGLVFKDGRWRRKDDLETPTEASNEFTAEPTGAGGVKLTRSEEPAKKGEKRRIYDGLDKNGDIKTVLAEVVMKTGPRFDQETGKEIPYVMWRILDGDLKGRTREDAATQYEPLPGDLDQGGDATQSIEEEKSSKNSPSGVEKGIYQDTIKDEAADVQPPATPSEENKMEAAKKKAGKLDMKERAELKSIAASYIDSDSRTTSISADGVKAVADFLGIKTYDEFFGEFAADILLAIDEKPGTRPSLPTGKVVESVLEA